METSSCQPGKKRSGATSGTKKIQLGWLHFQETVDRYVSIRQSKGGGTREITVCLDATASKIIERAKALFFPDGKRWKYVIFTDKFQTGVDYWSFSKWLKVTLYFTKIYKFNQTTKSEALFSIKEQSWYKGRGKIIWETQRGIIWWWLSLPVTTREWCWHWRYYRKQRTQECWTRKCQATSDLETSRILKAQQDKAYQASLIADQAKEKERLEQLQLHLKEVEQQETLRKARMLRVGDEPQKTDDVVLLQVRHVTIGNIKRYFKQSDQMQAVYDWVGSSSLLPMRFQLSDFTGHVYLPGESVTSSKQTTLNMAAC